MDAEYDESPPSPVRRKDGFVVKLALESAPI
jgi:hypothetical protein